MIARYTRPEMAEVWEESRKFDYWLKVELAILDAKCQQGQITPEQYEAIRAHAGFTVERITELDTGPNGFNHDLLAFVETVKEILRYNDVDDDATDLFHVGVTSYDIEDNAFPLQLQAACQPITNLLPQTRESIYSRALEFKLVPMMALTHGQAAEPTTLGKKLLDYVDMLDQHIKRLALVVERVRVGRLAGAVGNYGHLGPEFEQQVCRSLGLEPVRISTQIINRSRFAELSQALTLLAIDIEHIAEGLWQMCAYPRQEAREPFGRRQRGSSAMPHKKNPITLERLLGLSAVAQGFNHMIEASVPTRDERAINQSCIERIAWPDLTTIVHYMLHLLKTVFSGATFFPEQITRNIEGTFGTFGAGFVKDELLARGIGTLMFDGEEVETYVFVQSCAFRAWQERRQMRMVLCEQGLFGATEIFPDAEAVFAACFDPNRFLTHINEIFSRFGHIAS